MFGSLRKNAYFCTAIQNMKLYSDEELADILDQPIFHQISDAADRLGVECYVVGGYVRDIFLERPSNDIDVVVVGKPQTESHQKSGGERPVSVGIEVAKELKRMLGRRAHLSVFKNFGTAQVKFIEERGERREKSSSSVPAARATATTHASPSSRTARWRTTRTGVTSPSTRWPSA